MKHCKCDPTQYDIRNCSGQGTGELYKYTSCSDFDDLKGEECTNGLDIRLLDVFDLELHEVCCFRDLNAYCQEEMIKCMNSEQRKEIIVDFERYTDNLSFDCKGRDYYNRDNCTDPVDVSGVGKERMKSVILINLIYFLYFDIF